MVRRSTAARWESWRQRGGLYSTPAVSTGGNTQSGVPILAQQFGTQLYLVVEIAWGADLSAPSGSWVWYDVTTDVQVDSGKHIAMTCGRQDERSVAGPASCSFTLDNRLNKYSSAAVGQNWPNVKRGVPLRVRTVLNNASKQTLFQGNVSSMTPSFDGTGAYSITTVTANGILRRLGQGSAPLQSTMRTYTPTVASLLAYWPMEDGESAASFASAGPTGVAGMGFAGSPVLHSNTSSIGSDALPVMNGYAYGAVPAYSLTGQVQVRMIVAWPAAAQALGDQVPLFRVFTTGSCAYWDVVYHTGGALSAAGYSVHDGTKVFDSGTFGYNVDGTTGQIGLSLTQSGGDIAVQMSYFSQFATSAGYTNATATGQTVGAVTSVLLLPFGLAATVVFGHVQVQSMATDIFENTQPVSAYNGEWAGDRLGRLLLLAGAESRGMFTDSNGATTRMGPQALDTPMNLIREAESTAVAFILDGLDASVTAWSHTAVENMTPSMTLDATLHLVPPFTVTDDDQSLTNSWTLSQRNGSSVTYTDQTGPNGSNRVGLYQNSANVNVFPNSPAGTRTGAFDVKAIQDRASWLTHDTTVDGYRIPTLDLAFHHTPTLLPTWLSTIQNSGMGRIDIVNLSSVYPQMPTGTISLLVVGFSQVIDQFLWTTTLNCIPYDPWRVGVLSQPSGDTGEFLLRLDTSGSTVVTGMDVGATALTVATTTGPVWTTRADDFPLSVSVGGIRVTVTNITGSSSPQVFTIDPATVTKGLPAGLAVSMWVPPVLAIGVTS